MTTSAPIPARRNVVDFTGSVPFGLDAKSLLQLFKQASLDGGQLVLRQALAARLLEPFTSLVDHARFGEGQGVVKLMRTLSALFADNLRKIFNGAQVDGKEGFFQFW